jgi:hypothetical protein
MAGDGVSCKSAGMEASDRGTKFFGTVQKQLIIESKLVESHLATLDRELVKLSDHNVAAARWMQEAIRMKRRRLESIRRQMKRLEEDPIGQAGPGTKFC